MASSRSTGYPAEEGKHMPTLRYISLFTSFLVALSAGSNYGFSSYSPQLQEKMHLTSTQINIVGVMGNMGVYLSGPIWGRLVDKKGPKVALGMGASLVLIGYGGLSMAYDGKFGSNAPILLLALLSLSTGLGNCAGFTAAMNAQAKSWGEERRGLCTALVLSGFGLSAFFYSSLSHTLFPGKTGSYLLLLALGSSLSFLVGFFLVRIVPQEEQPEAESYTDSDSSGNDDSQHRHTEAPVKPRYIRRRTSSDISGDAWAYNSRERGSKNRSLSTNGDDDVEEGRSMDRREIEAGERQGLLQEDRQESSQSNKQKTSSSEKTIDLTGWNLIKNVDFIILFFIMTLISGTGLLVINNIGTMTRTLYEYSKRHKELNATAFSSLSLFSLEDSIVNLDVHASSDGDVQQLQAHQVSAISIGNALGRIMIGILSDVLVNKTGRQAHRVCLLLLVCSLALISQGLAATPNVISDLKKLLGISSMTGLMYGTLFGLCPVLTFEWFGLRHFSQNWGIISLSPVLAGNIFNLLFGRIYDSHVPKEGHTHICPDGEECFRSVFQITEVAALIALLLAFTIIYRRVDRPKWSIFRKFSSAAGSTTSTT
ncbi:hypothetical protein CBS101457_004569 [Exobasidium rhododendri]|nr:hypothetical protein CBS101457_004569 [Exobasidium rhododendri]